MEYTIARRLPESVDLMVLDSSGNLLEDVGLEELPGYLADKGALVWCDIYNTEGGQQGPYGRLLAETFGFDELTVEDCLTRSHLPKVDVYEDYLFLAHFSFHLSEKRRRVETVEVDMYIGENYVVCTSPALERARQGEAAAALGKRVRLLLPRQRGPHRPRRGSGRVPADDEQALGDGRRHRGRSPERG